MEAEVAAATNVVFQVQHFFPGGALDNWEDLESTYIEQNGIGWCYEVQSASNIQTRTIQTQIQMLTITIQTQIQLLTLVELRNQLLFSQLRKLPWGNSWHAVTCCIAIQQSDIEQ